MITAEFEVPKCPDCGHSLERTYRFTLFQNGEPNVHVCTVCNQVVLSWRLFILHGDTDYQRNFTIVPTNDRIHKDFIRMARNRSETEGEFRFDLERLFVLTWKQFRSFKKEFSHNMNTGPLGVVIEAYKQCTSIEYN